MSIKVSAVDSTAISEFDLGKYHDLVLAVAAVDRPEDPPPTRAWTEGWLNAPDTPDRTSRVWIARHDDEVIGVARLTLPGHENGKNAQVEMRVSPLWRRQGVALSLMRSLIPIVQEHDRTTLFSWVVEGAPASLMAQRLPFTVSHTNYLQVLNLAEVDRNRWNATTPDGYRAVQWIGSVPDDLLESFAVAKKAIQDAPFGGNSYRIPEWTGERIRAVENDLIQRGIDHRVVVAVHEATGEIAGLTELQFHPGRDQVGIQQDTSVRPSHRGHGLGHFVKVRMLDWMTATRDPQPTSVMTTTGTENTHMRRINEDLGFELARKIQLVEADVDELIGALDARADRDGGVLPIS